MISSIITALCALVFVMLAGNDIVFGVISPTTLGFILEAIGMTILSAIFYRIR
jgi:hypothetical protein